MLKLKALTDSYKLFESDEESNGTLESVSGIYK